MTRKVKEKRLMSLKKELPAANNIPDEVHMKAGAIARSLMGLPPLSEEELKKERNWLKRILRLNDNDYQLVLV